MASEILTAPQILSEEQVAEIEALSAKVPDGPWFADADTADDVPDHRRSGLALVDTGRGGDWWIARLCEWHIANFIAASKTNVDALCHTVRALRADVDKFSTLADERHDLLSAERRAHDELRAERSKMLEALERTHQDRNSWRRTSERLETEKQSLQSRLSEVEKERDRWKNRADYLARKGQDVGDFRTRVINLCNQKAAERETESQSADMRLQRSERDVLESEVATINELREAIENLGTETTEKEPPQ